MASNELTSRGSASGGRLLAAAAALFVVLQAAQAAAGQPATNLTVREGQGVYRVTARFLIDQPRSAALAVLTDYEEIPRFMPDVRTSVVRAHRERRSANGAAIVSESGCARLDCPVGLVASPRTYLRLRALTPAPRAARAAISRCK